MEEMLKSGMSMEQVLEHFQREAEKKELKNKLQALLDDQNASTDEIFNALRSSLSDADNAKIDEMLKRGMTMEEIIKHFMGGGLEGELPTTDEIQKKRRDDIKDKIQNLMNDPNASTEDVFKALKAGLSKEEQAKMEEMLKLGMSKEDIIKHFMSGGMEEKEKADKQKEREQLKNKLKDLLNNPDAKPEDVFKAMMSQLSKEDQAKIDAMLAKGMTMEQIINHFMKGGMDEVVEESDFAKKMKELVGGKNLSEEQMLALMKSQLGEGSKAELEEMLKSGMTLADAMKHFMEHGKTEEQEQAERVKAALEDPNIFNEDKMKLLQETLSDEAKAAMEKLLADGYTMDEVMKLMAAHGNDVEGLAAAAAALSNEETEFKKKMKELAGGKDLTEEQMLELMKSQLGAGSRAELEALLAKGVSLQDAMNYMMRNGKTEEEEAAILAQKIRAGMEGKNMTDREKIEFLRQNLSDEAKAAMDELLAQGYTMEEVIELFKKHGNNLNAIDQELTSPSVSFEDEPADAHLYANRDVFSMIDRETVKDQVPFMSPSIKNLTFKQFIDKVQKLVKGRGLTHREILDIMEFRLGGLYLQEMRDLRGTGATLAEVVEYFLKKDVEMRQQARRKARLEAQAKVDAFVDIKRPFIKNLWGVQISYTFSDEFGLHLVLGRVEEG